jgi:hypothetical protein
MPTEIRKRSNEADVKRYPDMDPVEMSFDVLEWLEGERLEHEKRMRSYGVHTNLKRMPLSLGVNAI